MVPSLIRGLFLAYSGRSVAYSGMSSLIRGKYVAYSGSFRLFGDFFAYSGALAYSGKTWKNSMVLFRFRRTLIFFVWPGFHVTN